MYTATKKALSIFLTLVMVFAMLPAVTLTFAPKAEAASAYPTYTKTYDTEYHYQNGTQYIYQLAVASHKTQSTAQTLLANAGFTQFGVDLNVGAGGNYIYAGYTTTSDPAQACKAVVVWDLTESSDGYNYYVDQPFNGADRRFYAVGSGADTLTPNAASGVVDLNEGCASGSHEQYLFATADYGAGFPVTAVEMANGTDGSGSNLDRVWHDLTDAGYTVVHSFQSANPEDLNEGAKSGHDNLYLGYKNADASLFTAVDSDRLRAAYAALNDCYANGGSLYAGLSTPLSAASAILADLADGYTTSDQAAIDAATLALWDALPAMALNTEATLTVPNTAAKRWLKFTAPQAGTYVFFSCAASGDPSASLFSRESAYGLDPVNDAPYAANDDAEEVLSRMAGIGSEQFYFGEGHYLYQNNTVYLCVEFPAGNAGACPIKVCGTQSITFYNTGGEGYLSRTFPVGHGIRVDRTGITRSGHTLAAWSASGDGYQDRHCTAGDLYTVTGGVNLLYARWSPDDPPVLALNTDYTATLDAQGEAEYYLFTPSETGDYVLYGVNNTNRTCATLSNWADYPGTAGRIGGANGNGDAALGQTARDFCLKARLTAGTAYLFGVKFNQFYDTGSVNFRLARYYTVSFDANGGTGGTQSAVKYHGRDLALSGLTAPTREGYIFLGWSESANATAPTYAANGVYTADADATLYAVWRRNPCTVTLDDNYGGGYSNTVSVTYGENMPSILDLPTRAGYAFDGFYDTAEPGGTLYFNGNGTPVHIWDKEGATATLYARWIPLTAVETVAVTLTESPVYNGYYSSIGVQSFGEGTGVDPCDDLTWRNGAGVLDDGLLPCGVVSCSFRLAAASGYWFPPNVTVSVSGAQSVTIDRGSNGESLNVEAAFNLHDYSDWTEMTQQEIHDAVSGGLINDPKNDLWERRVCNNCGESEFRVIPSLEVSFAFNADGAALAPIKVKPHSALGSDTLPAPPSVIGWQFDGWYTDSAYTVALESTTVRGNITLYGKYTFVPDVQLSVGPNEIMFSQTVRVCGFTAPAAGVYNIFVYTPSCWNLEEESFNVSLEKGESLSLHLQPGDPEGLEVCTITQLTPVEEVPIVLSEPLRGDILNLSVKSFGAEYGVESCVIEADKWLVNGNGFNPVSGNARCCEVRGVFTLTPKDNYYFPDNVTVGVTEATAIRTSLSADRRTLTVTADFNTHDVEWETGKCRNCDQFVPRNLPERTFILECVIPLTVPNHNVNENYIFDSVFDAEEFLANARKKLPLDPERYNFVGWFLDEACTKPAGTHFALPGDRTVYGKYDPAFSVLSLGRSKEILPGSSCSFYSFTASETGKYHFNFNSAYEMMLNYLDDDGLHSTENKVFNFDLDLKKGETVPFKLESVVAGVDMTVHISVERQLPIHEVTLWFDSSASDDTLTQPTPVLVQSSLCDLDSHLNVISILKCCDVEYTCTISPKDGYYFADDCAVTVLGVPGSSALNISNYGDSITVNAAMKVHSSTSFSPWDDVSTEYAETLGLDHTDLGHWQYCNCNACNETVYRFVPDTYTISFVFSTPELSFEPVTGVLYGTQIWDAILDTDLYSYFYGAGYTYGGVFTDAAYTRMLTEDDVMTSDCSVYVSLTPDPLDVSLSWDEKPCNGAAQRPEVTVIYDADYVQYPCMDYTLSWSGDCKYPGTYTVTVTAANGCTAEKTFTILPSQPTGLTATPTAAGQITLSWNEVPGATQYNVYRYRGSDQQYHYIGTTFAADDNPTQYVNTGLSTGTTYYYKVVAVTKGSGQTLVGAYSPSVSARALGKPAIPQDVTVNPTGEKELTVSWSAVSDATQYNVYRYRGSDGQYHYLGTSFSTDDKPTEYADGNLAVGTDYYYKVVAVCKEGGAALVGDLSAPVSARVLGTPAVPQNVTVTPTAEQELTVSWSAVKGATQYNVYRWNGTEYKYAGTAFAADENPTAYADTGRTVGTDYYYKVLAVCKGGGLTFVGALSASVKAMALGKPGVPANVAVKPTAEKELTVSWDAVKGATQYNVYRYNGTTYKYAGTTFAADEKPTEYKDTGLTVGTDYYYKVVAAAKGNGLTFVGDMSAFTNTAALGKPGVPANVAVKPTAEKELTVSWSAVKGATQYNVYRYRGSDGAYHFIGAVFATDEKTTEYKDTGLTVGTVYYYKVVAAAKGNGLTFVGDMSASAKAAALGKPAVPANVTVTPTGEKELTVSWSAVKGATQYNVYRYRGSDGQYHFIGAAFATDEKPTEYVDTELSVGTSYYYKAVAVCKGSGLTFVGDMSASAMAAVLGTPAAPADVAVKPTGEKELTVSWSSVKGATQYNVYRYNGTAYKYIGTTFAADEKPTEYVDGNLTVGTDYYYKVVAACKGSGLTFVSGMSAFAHTVALGALPAPANVTAASAAARTITVSWSAVKGATQYNVYRYNGTRYQYIGTTFTTAARPNEYTDGNLTAGTDYYYKVVAAGKGNGLTFVSDMSAFAHVVAAG